ncbi:MAG: hypothetical protein NZ761_13330, partial [Dehalococcoidia bacterium]|nr:hypothetical protein [Dehalococcoidia bacterium]
MTLSVHQSTTPRALQPDFRSASWRRALIRALELYPPDPAVEWDGDTVAFLRWEGEPYASALLVRCSGSCRGGQPWHRVEWRADGLVCDCPSRYPCHHRARAWAEWDGSWRMLKQWSRWFGPAAAVAGIVWLETRDLEATRVAAVHDLGFVREPDGTVRDATMTGRPLLPTGRFSTGFNCGYRGSGVQELAFCALAKFYGPALAEERRSGLVAYLERLPI